MTLFTVDSESVGDIFERMEEAEDLIAARLGPKAFQIVKGAEEELHELLVRLNAEEI